MPKRRTPADLSQQQLVALVEDLLEKMYLNDDEEWDPEKDVDGLDLVCWAGDQLSDMGLVPKAGPRE